jgi:hypothetical protein
MSSEPSNDPAKSYLDTLERDPFGLFAGMTLTSQSTKPIHTFSAHPAFAEDVREAGA